MREITVNASPDRVGQVTDFVNQLLAELDYQERIRVEVDVAVDELFSNIVRYAYRLENGTVTVRLKTEDNPLSIVIMFIDHGIPFNPLEEKRPDTTVLPAGKRPIGGLGLFMVRKIMDQIEYHFENGQNILIVRKAIAQNSNRGGEKKMATATFEKQGNTLTVKPTGRLDTATSPVLEKELHPYLDGVQELIVDFTNVEYISSGGLRMLLATDQQVESNGGNMKLIHVNEYIMDIFELIGFTDAMTVIRD